MKGMTEHLLVETQARSNLYGLLARFCREPVDPELLSALRTPGMTEALTDCGVNVSEALPDVGDDVLLGDLATAYTHAFVVSLSPYESMQKGEGQLWGPSTVAVQAFVQEVGLEITGENNLPPDHLAMELEFMHHLTDAEAQAIELKNNDIRNTAKQKQKFFLRKHLGLWAITFFDSLQEVATHPFYREVGSLGSSFVYQELERLT